MAGGLGVYVVEYQMLWAMGLAAFWCQSHAPPLKFHLVTCHLGFGRMRLCTTTSAWMSAFGSVNASSPSLEASALLLGSFPRTLRGYRVFTSHWAGFASRWYCTALQSANLHPCFNFSLSWALFSFPVIGPLINFLLAFDFFGCSDLPSVPVGSSVITRLLLTEE